MNQFHRVGHHIRRLMALSLGLSLLLQACSTPVETVTSPPSSPDREVNTEVEPPQQDRQSQDTLTISEGQMLPITAEATIREHVIQLEVAHTPMQQAIGLMFREDLPDNRGMLFPFNPPRPVQFWMRNVRFPLDMIFLYDGEIKAIAPSVPPCTTSSCPTYGPEGDVEYVLELKGGRAEALGLSVGDRVDIRPIEPIAPEAI